METLDFDAQRHERLSSQSQENKLRERHLLRAWHRAALQSNSQQNNNNNNNNNKNMLPRYGKIAGKEGGVVDQYFGGVKDRYCAPLLSGSLVLTFENAWRSSVSYIAVESVCNSVCLCSVYI